VRLATRASELLAAMIFQRAQNAIRDRSGIFEEVDEAKRLWSVSSGQRETKEAFDAKNYYWFLFVGSTDFRIGNVGYEIERSGSSGNWP